jgi:hypothetical protein
MEQHDPFDIAQQEEAQADTEIRKRLARETEESDFKWLMSSKRGRRIVWRLLDLAGVFRSSFNPTAMVMAFNEGNRNYGNRTLSLVHQYCPELYPQMMKENTNAGRNNSATRDTQ